MRPRCAGGVSEKLVHRIADISMGGIAVVKNGGSVASRPRVASVLIVDDDAALGRLVRMTLLNGYEVQTASNGLDALQQVDNLRPDVVVLDLEMPVMDGRALYRELRARGHHMPVLVLSAFGARSGQLQLGAQ